MDAAVDPRGVGEIRSRYAEHAPSVVLEVPRPLNVAIPLSPIRAMVVALVLDHDASCDIHQVAAGEESTVHRPNVDVGTEGREARVDKQKTKPRFHRRLSTTIEKRKRRTSAWSPCSARVRLDHLKQARPGIALSEAHHRVASGHELREGQDATEIEPRPLDRGDRKTVHHDAIEWVELHPMAPHTCCIDRTTFGRSPDVQLDRIYSRRDREAVECCRCRVGEERRRRHPRKERGAAPTRGLRPRRGADASVRGLEVAGPQPPS